MKKKLLGMILLFTIIFSFGCSSTQEQSTSENDPQETYSQQETTFGLSYEIPDSWKTPDTNSDTEIYHYKKEIGSGDGMLYIIYQEIDGDILTETSFNEFADGLLNSGYDTDGFQSEDFESNNIKMKKFSYNMEIEQTNYKTQGVVFNCYEGIVMITFSSFSESNYDSYFEKIISSVKSTDVIEEEFNENIVQNEDETEPIEDETLDDNLSENDSSNDSSTDDASYQSILDEYSEKIKEATPGLVDEYKNEAAEHSGDINKLAEISNDKVNKLAEISNEGIEEMANIMYSNGDDYDTYEEWSKKLMDVYTEYAEKIMDAYIDSAT